MGSEKSGNFFRLKNFKYKDYKKNVKSFQNCHYSRKDEKHRRRR
jgi:hypothetical protein